MRMTALEIAQQVADDIGISQPLALVSATNDLPKQMRAQLKLAMRDIAKRHNWQELREEADFTTVANELQIANIRTTWPDLLRICPDTVFNRSQNRKVYGNVNPTAWAAAKASVAITPDYHFRIRRNGLYLFGNPTAGDQIYFEYVSKYCWEDEDGLEKRAVFEADTDRPLFDDWALVLGLKWRMLRANGLEYGEAFREYEAHLAELRGSDTPKTTVSLTPSPQTALTQGYIPDGNWNL